MTDGWTTPTWRNMHILGLLISIGSLVCDILVIVKIFQANQVGLGILAIFCPLFTFIYGWVKVKEFNIQQIMLVWSVLVVAYIFINVMIMHSTVVTVQ